MTSIKKSITQLKEEDINEGNGKYELYNEYNNKVLMDSMYVKDNIENYDNYDKMYDKLYNNTKRKVPDICNIENEYKCKNILEDFDKLKKEDYNKIEYIDNKYDKEINNNYKENNNKYNELKKDIKMIRYFNMFLCLIISLIIVILITYKIL